MTILSLRAVAARLPAGAQDLLRAGLDGASPRRRRRPDHDALAAAVSPGGAVLAGPFAGLRLPTDVTWGGAAARLAGTYEREIAPSLEALIARAPSHVVDIGCAEGYYAVGLARRLPLATVDAYDIDPYAQRACRRTARLNHVSNVRVHGRMTPKRLAAVLRRDSLLIIDCEGYEDELLDPARTPGLVNVTIVAELHEFVSAGLSERVLERFRPSHDISLVQAAPRTHGDEPQLAHLTRAMAKAAVQEGRIETAGPMQWAVMWPSSRSERRTAGGR